MPNYPMQYGQPMPLPYAPAYGSGAWQAPPYPQYSQQATQFPQAPQPARQQTGGINWAQGIEGAKAFYVEPGKSELILESEGPVFYIKSVDASGIPAPLRIFHYSEEVASQSAAPRNTNYITRDELPELFAQLMAQRGGADNA